MNFPKLAVHCKDLEVLSHVVVGVFLCPVSQDIQITRTVPLSFPPCIPPLYHMLSLSVHQHYMLANLYLSSHMQLNRNVVHVYACPLAFPVILST